MVIFVQLDDEIKIEIYALFPTPMLFFQPLGEIVAPLFTGDILPKIESFYIFFCHLNFLLECRP